MRSFGAYLAIPLWLTTLGSVTAFTPVKVSFYLPPTFSSLWQSSQEVEQEVISDIATDSTSTLDPEAAEKFKIITCMSTSCCQKRKALGMDSLATFGSMYARIQQGNAPTVQLEEGPCLGACKKAPCVAVEHDDFIGSVSLIGMTDSEFSDRVFHGIITEEDADRVWRSVENGIKMMMEEENEEDCLDDDE